jgi:hypothetical protein
VIGQANRRQPAIEIVVAHAFPPEQVQLLADAFDDAWAIVATCDSVTDSNRQRKRAELAQRIVRLAETGEFDYDRLVAKALARANVAATEQPAHDAAASADAA